MREALCIEYENIEFFITRGQDDGPAKSICARCAVKAECLQYALERRIDHGVWGGTSGRERGDLRRSARSITARDTRT